MRLFSKISAFALALFAGSAQAVVLNFIDLADGPVYGESGYSTLTIGTASITGTKGGVAAFAYLDRGTAGLGVCGNVASTGQKGNSGTNQCTSGAGDDNVTEREELQFVFSGRTKITNIWFNNNHDGGFGAGDLVTIEGTDYTAVEGYEGDANAYSMWTVNAGEEFNVAWKNEEFYVSAIEFNTVPAPAMLSLMAIGLVGIGLRRRNERV